MTRTPPPAREARRPTRLRAAVVGLLMALSSIGATARTTVPHPAEIRPDVAAPDGMLGWVDGVVSVAGAVGETIAVDLGLDNGTDDELDIDLSVHGVEVDPVGGPSVRSETVALTLPTRETTLLPGDRLLLRATGPIPAEGRLLAVRATVTGSAGPATVDTFVVLSGGAPADLRVSAAGDDATVTTTIANRSPYPAVARLAIDARRWVGAADRVEITDLLVAGGSERIVTRDTPAGLGPVRVGVAVASGLTEATDRTVVWTTRAAAVAVAAVLVVVAGAGVAVARRRRDDGKAGATGATSATGEHRDHGGDGDQGEHGDR